MRIRALLIIAHGSRKEKANSEIAKLAVELASNRQEGIDLIEHAFLELAEPSIPQGIRNCIAKGAGTILILPYFLNTGMHVASDIPGFVDQACKSHPDIEIQLLPHLGSQVEQMKSFISQIVEANMK